MDRVAIPASSQRRGSNSVQIRRYNERVVLESLQRLGQASKAELARSTNLTPQAIAAIVDHLEEVGLVQPRGRRSGQIGQPSRLYAPAPDGAFSIGLHVGRRAFEAVLVDFTGRVMKAQTSDYDYPEAHAVAKLAMGAIGDLQDFLTSEQKARVVGIGLATPYFMSEWGTELGIPGPVTAAWDTYDLPATLSREIALPLFVENDASSAATAELVHGHGRDTRDFVYLFISTFIGGGVVIGGNLETGPHGNTGAFGPYPVGPSLLSSVPAPRGPFEILLRRASIYVLTHHLRTNGVPIRRVHELQRLGKRAEPYLSEWIADCADALAQAIIGAVAVIDVDAVVIDGILPSAILKRTVQAISDRFDVIVPTGLVAPRIVAGSVGPNAAAIGAAILPHYALFAPDSASLVKSRASGNAKRRANLQAHLRD